MAGVIEAQACYEVASRMYFEGTAFGFALGFVLCAAAWVVVRYIGSKRSDVNG